MARDVLVVGGGLAGLSAGVFTARAGLDTLIVAADESILARNAHLENYPGLPAGIDPRLLMRMARDQADEAGCSFREGRVTDLRRDGSGFAATVAPTEGDPRLPTRAVETPARTEIDARRVVAASWPDASYLDGLDVTTRKRGSKTFVQTDGYARTGVDGLYAAGRLAGQYHQAVVCAGHGGTAGVSVVKESDVEFYHDWVTPEDYFTGRDRDVPPGCEEIDDAERETRDERARRTLRAYVAEPMARGPTQHPEVADGDDPGPADATAEGSETVGDVEADDPGTGGDTKAGDPEAAAGDPATDEGDDATARND